MVVHLIHTELHWCLSNAFAAFTLEEEGGAQHKPSPLFSGSLLGGLHTLLLLEGKKGNIKTLKMSLQESLHAQLTPGTVP